MNLLKLLTAKKKQITTLEEALEELPKQMAETPGCGYTSATEFLDEWIRLRVAMELKKLANHKYAPRQQIDKFMCNCAICEIERQFENKNKYEL